MPSPVATAGGTAQSTAPKDQRSAPVAAVPFRRATREHVELVASYTQAQTANPQVPPTGTVQIPAYGYLRGIWIKVTATGASGTATFAENGPWSALQNIMLTEPNGAQIVQFNSGYTAMLARKWGGYFGFNDPEVSNYSTSAGGNYSFLLYIPIELNDRDALGSLPNQNAAAMFVLKYQLAGSGSIYSSAPATLPTAVAIEIWAEEYDQPSPTSDNATNMTTPPAMNTTQFWSEQSYPVVSGYNRIRLTRVGNYIRNLICMFTTTAAGTRAAGDTNWPTTTQWNLDARPITFFDKTIWRDQMYRRSGFTAGGSVALDAAGGQDAGVFVYDFCHEFDGRLGHENRDAWLKTYGSSRLELEGNFGAAGTLTVLTNDVAIASNVFLG